MLDISSVSIKEAVEIIEARLPGGKVLTRIVLFLVVAAVIVWSFLYVWHTAVVPLAHFVTALVTGTIFTIHITLGSVITFTVIICFYCIASLALRGLIRRINKLMDRTVTAAETAMSHSQESTEYAKKALASSEKAVEVAARAVDAAEKMKAKLDETLKARD